MTIYFIDRVTITRERFEIEAASPAEAGTNIHLASPRGSSTEIDVQITESSAPLKRTKSIAKKGTRIPQDWAPDVAYATSKGMTEREINLEAEKFRLYWENRPGTGATKLDWNRTWFTWCLSFCERAGRQPPSAPVPSAAVMSDAQWNKALDLFWKSERWHRDFGPEPGRPGCRVPAHLLPSAIRAPRMLAPPSAAPKLL